MFLYPLDFAEENESSLIVPADTVLNGNSVTLDTSLPFRRRFNLTVLAHGCEEHPVTDTIEISMTNNIVLVLIAILLRFVQVHMTFSAFPLLHLGLTLSE